MRVETEYTDDVIRPIGYDLLDRLLEPVGSSLTPDAARRLLNARADEAVQARIDELADRCNEGLLTPEEREEYETYVSVSQIVGILQAKARRVLTGDAAA